MSPDRFNHLSDLLRKRINKKHHIRPPIPPEEGLAVTLRYLATGNTKQAILFEFKLGKSTGKSVLLLMKYAMNSGMSWKILYRPRLQKMTDRKFPDYFLEFWNIPHCIGALECASLLSQDLFGIITRDSSAWFTSQYAMRVTVLVL